MLFRGAKVCYAEPGVATAHGGPDGKKTMVMQISPRDLARRLANEHQVFLLDVRQSWEHGMAAIAGSTLIPLSELAGRAGEIKPPADGLIVVYCHHGMRSMSGAAILQRAGFANVASLAGGIDAWSCEVDPGVARY
jgi:rhodanese-related sulfurtransferase